MVKFDVVGEFGVQSGTQAAVLHAPVLVLGVPGFGDHEFAHEYVVDHGCVSVPLKPEGQACVFVPDDGAPGEQNVQVPLSVFADEL